MKNKIIDILCATKKATRHFHSFPAKCGSPKPKRQENKFLEKMLNPRKEVRTSQTLHKHLKNRLNGGTSPSCPYYYVLRGMNHNSQKEIECE